MIEEAEIFSNIMFRNLEGIKPPQSQPALLIWREKWVNQKYFSFILIFIGLDQSLKITGLVLFLRCFSVMEII